MIVERVERQTLSDRQIVATFMAAGVKNINLPSVPDALSALDASLVEVPSDKYAARRLVLEALGVSDG